MAKCTRFPSSTTFLAMLATFKNEFEYVIKYKQDETILNISCDQNGVWTMLGHKLRNVVSHQKPASARK